jgi:hypothetical protein
MARREKQQFCTCMVSLSSFFLLICLFIMSISTDPEVSSR